MQGYEANNSPAASAEVKNIGAIPPLIHMPSWNTSERISNLLLAFASMDILGFGARRDA
jgi:hypothetical protein